LLAQERPPANIQPIAVVCDALRLLTPAEPPETHWAGLPTFQKADAAHQAVAVLAAYLIADEWFLSRRELVPKICNLFLADGLARLARLVKPERLLRDADRREEFVRLCLKLLDLRPNGETEIDAADRLNSLDSFERERVVRATAVAERRAREVREAIARRQAQEAASRYGE
jgi:hypothetical protein